MGNLHIPKSKPQLFFIRENKRKKLNVDGWCHPNITKNNFLPKTPEKDIYMYVHIRTCINFIKMGQLKKYRVRFSYIDVLRCLPKLKFFRNSFLWVLNL